MNAISSAATPVSSAALDNASSLRQAISQKTEEPLGGLRPLDQGPARNLESLGQQLKVNDRFTLDPNMLEKYCCAPCASGLPPDLRNEMVVNPAIRT